MTYDTTWRDEDDAQINAVAAAHPELAVVITALANISQGIIGRSQLRTKELKEQILTAIGGLAASIEELKAERGQAGQDLRGTLASIQTQLGALAHDVHRTLASVDDLQHWREKVEQRLTALERGQGLQRQRPLVENDR
jgi:predicted amino acid dehydrogenase